MYTILNFYFSRTELVKFIYSEKATKFCEIFSLLLSYVVPVKSKVKISQNLVAFSEYMNFNSVNNLLSYCGLNDVKMSTSDKDLPVQ